MQEIKELLERSSPIQLRSHHPVIIDSIRFSRDLGTALGDSGAVHSHFEGVPRDKGQTWMSRLHRPLVCTNVYKHQDTMFIESIVVEQRHRRPLRG